MLHDPIWVGTGSALGRSFTGNIDEQQIVKKDGHLHQFLMGMKCDGAAAITLEDFLMLVQPFTFKAGSETRIQLNGRDLVALSAFVHGQVPTSYENAGTNDCKVLGIKIPVHEDFADDKAYSVSARRSAVSNGSGEVIHLTGVWTKDRKGGAPIHAVEMAGTTPGAVGVSTLNNILPQVGEMEGLLLYNTAYPDADSDASSIQRITIVINGVKTSTLDVAVGGLPGLVAGLSAGDPLFDVLAPYSAFDFRAEPIDCKGQRVSIEIDTQDATDNFRLIPIMRIK